MSVSVQERHLIEQPSEGHESMNPTLIFDLGMHRGEDSEFYLKKGFSVVAVEANPELARLGATRLRDYVDSGKLTIVNQAIADHDGEITFYVNNLVDYWSTIHRERADFYAGKALARFYNLPTAEVREVTVRARRFADILREHGTPYYLKMDVEGAELLCLKDLFAFEGRPRFISLESSQTFTDVFSEFAWLWTMGYRRYKIIPQQAVPRQRPPLPAREGQSIEHTFEFGSSGLFGDELPGAWLGIEASLKVYRRILRGHRLIGEGGRVGNPWVRKALKKLGWQAGWYDTHAMYCPDA